MTTPFRPAAAPPPDATVVLCAYTERRWDDLQDAVASVRAQSRPPAQVVVVIDHNEDLLALARGALVGAEVIASQGPRGLSGARNTGLAAAATALVAFLDDDAVAEETWLEHLLAPYDDPTVVGTGGLVVPHWTTPPPRWFPESFGWVLGCSYTGLPTALAAVRNPIGANMSFRRDPLAAVGGFSTAVGRVGTNALGCEETEVSIRLTALGDAWRILHVPEAVVHHKVPDDRATFRYFTSRCLAEGRSKASVSRMVGRGPALSAERHHVTRTLPRAVVQELGSAGPGQRLAGAARAGAIVSGTAAAATGYASSLLTRKETNVSTSPAPTPLDPCWRGFDVHGLVGLRVHRDAAALAQLDDMFACFATDADVPADLTVSDGYEPLLQATVVEDELRYTQHGLEVRDPRVQVVLDGDEVRLHGRGELLTSVVPLLDHLMVARGAAMIHAATVAVDGIGVAMPASGGSGKTSTIAKLARHPDVAFLGDDWAFIDRDGTLLGYAKPMFIKPHHRELFPHLFSGVRKPLVPSALSTPVAHLTTAVHPHIIRYPRLAAAARHWSPEHRMVHPADALPGMPMATQAPLGLVVFLERHDGATLELRATTPEWMAQRLVGNFHLELAEPSRRLLTALGATGLLPLEEHLSRKRAILDDVVRRVPTYLLRVPAALSPDDASTDIVAELLTVIRELRSPARSG